MHLLVSFLVADLKAAAPRAQLLSEVLNRAHTSGLAAVPREGGSRWPQRDLRQHPTAP